VSSHGLRGRSDVVYSSGRADSLAYGGGFPPGADLRAFVLKERIPHLPEARCRGHSELFDERPADDPYRDAITKRALAVCSSCPALGRVRSGYAGSTHQSARVGLWPAE
jgi:hypothetical protein